MKLGLIEIEKAYLGTLSLTSSTAFLGTVPIIAPQGSYDGLKFTSTGATTISMSNTGNNAPDMKYSLNGGSSWTQWNYSSISLADGDEICFKGNNTNGFNYSSNNRSTFVIDGSGTIAASGNIMGLIDNGLCTTTTIPNDYCFGWLFLGCSKLSSAPDLPATTLTSSCYRSMFLNCTSLTTAPELPAATLAQECYYYMFRGCSLLNYVKCLATNIAATDCTYLWLSLVSATGTFEKDDSMTSWPTGDSGIPTGWTVPVHDDRFRLEALADNSVIGLAKKGSAYDLLQYSLDGDTWNDLTTSTSVTLNTGDKMFIRGHVFKDLTVATDYNNLSITGNVAAKGNIMYLYDYTNPSGTTATYSRAFRKLFDTNCLGLTQAHELIIPATTLGVHACSAMFSKATNLTTAPNLPATTIGEGCYLYMFELTAITLPPIIAATTLGNTCCANMFKDCKSLTTAPTLPATTLIYLCYRYMFLNCTSLTTAPTLPATILADSCYLYMFLNCTSLTTAPTLSATTLANYCCAYMFLNCTSLTTAPVTLPATTLALGCYLYMFSGCTSLTTAPALPATTLAPSCYYLMFLNCSNLISAPALPATTLAASCYKNMFNGCSQINYINCQATDISATNCTYQWVSGVAATGTFVRNTNGDDWTYGINGVPSGWTVSPAFGYRGLKFKSTGSTTIGLYSSGGNAPDMKYSLDDGLTWTQWDYSSISLADGDEVYFKGNNTSGFNNYSGSGSTYSGFSIGGSGTLAASGNIMSIIDDGACTTTTIPNNGCFYSLFRGCAKLTTAPNLPATALQNYCYENMFRECTSLTSTPTLPATYVPKYGYAWMFCSCTSLNYVKVLAVTHSTENCTFRFVYDVAATGTWVKASSATWNTDQHGVPEGWTVVNA